MSSWLALSLFMLLGVVALLVDSGRYFAMKSRFLDAATNAALLGAEEYALQPEESLSNWLTTQIIQELAGDDGFLSVSGGDLKNLGVNISFANGQEKVAVKLTGDLIPLMVKSLNISDGIGVSAAVTASVEVTGADIALLIDGSNSAAVAGQLELARASALGFLDQLDGMDTGQKISVALLGNAARLINVAPRNDWLAAGLWPEAVPPAVPGRALWAGALNQTRWCVRRRAGVSGQNLLTPTEVPFDLEMEITISTDTGGTDEYAVTTTVECPILPIMPLHPARAPVKLALSDIEAAGDYYPGRAIVWGRRLISGNWRAAWNRAAAAAENKKMMILISGSPPTGDIQDRDDLIKACLDAKEAGERILIIGPDLEAGGIAEDCSGSTYLGADYEAGFRQILRFLRHARLFDIE